MSCYTLPDKILVIGDGCLPRAASQVLSLFSSSCNHMAAEEFADEDMPEDVKKLIYRCELVIGIDGKYTSLMVFWIQRLFNKIGWCDYPFLGITWDNSTKLEIENTDFLRNSNRPHRYQDSFGSVLLANFLLLSELFSACSSAKSFDGYHWIANWGVDFEPLACCLIEVSDNPNNKKEYILKLFLEMKSKDYNWFSLLAGPDFHQDFNKWNEYTKLSNEEIMLEPRCSEFVEWVQRIFRKYSIMEESSNA